MLQVREQYLKSEAMDNREQTYAAINKLVSSLDDPFTRFLPPDRLAALRRGNSGAQLFGVPWAEESCANLFPIAASGMVHCCWHNILCCAACITQALSLVWVSR